jgi:predicted RNase H-like nuclease (RuvC/YqgF family)
MTMPENVRSAFARYEQLKTEVKTIESEIKDLQPIIIPYIPEGAEIETNDGKFTINRKMAYVYSSRVKTMEEELKEAKKREEQDGTAVPNPGEPFIKYNPKRVGKSDD